MHIIFYVLWVLEPQLRKAAPRENQPEMLKGSGSWFLSIPNISDYGLYPPLEMSSPWEQGLRLLRAHSAFHVLLEERPGERQQVLPVAGRRGRGSWPSRMHTWFTVQRLLHNESINYQSFIMLVLRFLLAQLLDSPRNLQILIWFNSRGTRCAEGLFGLNKSAWRKTCCSVINKSIWSV